LKKKNKNMKKVATTVYIVLFLERVVGLRPKCTSLTYSVTVSRCAKDKNIEWSLVDMKIVGGANELSSVI